MSQLHLHVISDDFNSERLKNKKHWNSFTTEFFIPANDFLAMLEQGKVHFDKQKYEELLKKPLACHRCSLTIPTIPKLKLHIKTCKK